MFWFNGSITITLKTQEMLFIYDIPFDANIQTRVMHKLQEEGYTQDDILWAQYFPSTIDIKEI